MAAMKQPDYYTLENFEGPLSMGVSSLVAAGIGNLIWPAPFLSNVMLYGGLVVFSGLLMTDIQGIHRRAQQGE